MAECFDRPTGPSHSYNASQRPWLAPGTAKSPEPGPWEVAGAGVASAGLERAVRQMGCRHLGCPLGECQAHAIDPFPKSPSA